MTAAEDFRLGRIAVPAYGPSLLSGIGLGAVTPIVPLLALDLGATPALAGVIVTLEMVGSLCASLPGSVVTARIGERPALVVAALVGASTIATMAVARSLWALSAAAFVMGAAQAVFALARQTYLTEAVPFALRARALSTLGGVMRIGMFVGPLTGAGMIVVGGRPAVFAMAVAFLLLAAALAARLPDLPGERALRRPAGVRLIDVVRRDARFFRTLGLALALLSAVRGMRQVALPLWSDHLGLGDAATSLIVAISWGVDTALFYPGGWVMDRFGRRVSAMPTTLGMGAAFALLPFTQGFWPLLAVAVLVAVGNGFGSGIVMTIMADASPDVGRPQFLGAARFLTDVGSVGGPALLSGLTAAASLGLGVGSAAVLAVGAGVMFLRWLPRQAGPAARQGPPPDGPATE